jgi:hypothetical protein
MPNTKWESLSSLQIGRYAEYYAKMEVASYGLEVYTSEVDDHGIDFIVRKPKSTDYYEIQVKSIRHDGYVFMTKKSWDIEQKNLHLILVIFDEDKTPDIFLIPATAWQDLNDLFRFRAYDGADYKSEPEYGLNLSQKNMYLLEPYIFESFIKNFKK